MGSYVSSSNLPEFDTSYCSQRLPRLFSMESSFPGVITLAGEVFQLIQC